jgi:alanine racemase
MLLEKVGPKWIEVDLDQLAKNISIIANQVKPANVIPVIKANAYGHGAIEVARALEKQNCETVAVATLGEAIQLRKNMIKMDILLFGVIPITEIQDIVNYKITPTICTIEFANKYAELCQRFGTEPAYHFYVDTGMGRMGYSLKESTVMFREIQAISNLSLKAIYSHFSVSDEMDSESQNFTQEQYEKMLAWVSENKIKAPLHMANSGAILQHTPSYFDSVRPGLCTYGVNPNTKGPMLPGLKPIMKIKCKALFIKTMNKGDSIGYGRETVLKEKSNIMTLPVGYADGLPRSLAKGLKAMIGGKAYPIAGRICMDMTMIDLGLDELTIDSEVTLMGSEVNSIYEWSELSDMIPYEVLTRLGTRWAYVYYENNDIKTILKM